MFELTESTDLTPQLNSVNPSPFDTSFNSNPIIPSPNASNDSQGQMMPILDIDWDTFAFDAKSSLIPAEDGLNWSDAAIAPQLDTPKTSLPFPEQDNLLGLARSQSLTGLASTRPDPLTSAQNTSLTTAQYMGSVIGERFANGIVSASDPADFFRFKVDTASDLNVMISDIGADADLYLLWDGDRDGILDDGEIIQSSTQAGIGLDMLHYRTLPIGEYYLAVAGFEGASTSYTLSALANPVGGLNHQTGTLWGDRFTVDLNQAYSVVSGNGNVSFGWGYADHLDLSTISADAVSTWNPATASGGGVLYDAGDGLRVFDEMVLANGSRILMEGMDQVLFAEGYLDLNSGALPNDPLFSEQWNLHMMGVHNAWRFTQGSDQVLNGVQDTGLGVDEWGQLHPDLDPRRTYFHGSNNVSDDFEARNGSASHGTAVHSIIGGASNNGFGMSGINWVSDTLNIDVLGGDINDYSLANATQLMTDYATTTGRRLVVNMSLGGGAPSASLEQLIASNQDNALFVIAAGNDDLGSLSYPAYLSNAYSNVMSIGASWGAWDTDGNATNPGDRISYPDWWGSNYGYGLSLMGPSEVIAAESAPTSSGVTHDFYLNATTGDFPFNGTSAAAPNVAGVASLVWSANPYLSARQVNGILHETAYDLGFQGYDYEYGAGFVNADAAVRRAMAIAGTPLYGQTAPAIGFMTTLGGALAAQTETMMAAAQTGSANASDGSNFQAAIAAGGVNPLTLGQGRGLLSIFGDIFEQIDSTLAAYGDRLEGQMSEQGLISALAPDSLAQVDWASAWSTAEGLDDELLDSLYELPWQIDALTGQSLIAA